MASRSRTPTTLPAPVLGHLRLPIGDLRPYPGNPRRGDVDLIVESLCRLGQYRPVVVNAGTFTGRPLELLAGNHTIAAARQMLASPPPDDPDEVDLAAVARLHGLEEPDCWMVDVDDDEARRIVLVDNRANDMAGYDDEALARLLSELGTDLGGTGYDAADLDLLLAGLEEDYDGGEPDDAPPIAGVAVSQPGDVWKLGEHRLFVGDATDLGAVLAVLGDDRADCVWTDPPYGVDYVGKTTDALTIAGDTAGVDLGALLAGAFATIRVAAKPGAAVYVACPPGPAMLEFLTAFRGPLLLRQILVWVKNTIVMGHSDFHYQHEAMLAGETPDDDEDEPEPKAHDAFAYGFVPPGKQKLGRLGRGGRRWFGGNNQSTVFEIPKPAASTDHPTMKPVALVEAMLRVSCRPRGLVLDLFGGSGSTLIAAHRLGRRAVLVELDPRYADVICRRWQKFTGQPATRAGVPFDEAA